MTTPNTSGNEGQHSGGRFTPGLNREPFRYETRTAGGLWHWGLFDRSGTQVAWGGCCETRAAAQGEARRTREFFAQADAALALGTAPGSVGEGDSVSQSQPLADAGPNSPRSPDNHSFDGKEGA